jgi:hypothetical protein
VIWVSLVRTDLCVRSVVPVVLQVFLERMVSVDVYHNAEAPVARHAGGTGTAAAVDCHGGSGGGAASVPVFPPFLNLWRAAQLAE